MDNPKYFVTISNVPSRAIGQQNVNIAGVTQSMHSYSGEYFLASMPELRLTATGSSYTDALDNLLLIATASTTPNNGFSPITNIKFF
ncbi:MAG: hypothetical protein EBU90_11865 [Proteobacteria bacterium]|nr:hypothetical protein [Pseudomonadota bacterium]NBP15358.1 hypothetical protein [bacterium]